MSFAQDLFASLGSPAAESRLMQTITHFPSGDRAAGVEIDAFVDLGQELGTNEMPGDGAITKDNFGDRERRTGHIEVLKTLAVTPEDQWEIDGEWWTTQREDGTDTGDSGQYRGIRITLTKGRRTQNTLVKGIGARGVR